MTRNIGFHLVSLIVITLLINGCLTTESKEYSFTLNSDGSGSGEIKFINIVSQEDEGKDVSFSDFDDLMNNWINGDDFEKANPRLRVKSKELYEDKGQLCGKVSFTFDRVRDINLYRFDNYEDAPMIFYFGDLTETLIETNGKRLSGGKDIPIIYIDGDARSFTYKTQVEENMSNTHSLLSLHKVWIKNR